MSKIKLDKVTLVCCDCFYYGGAVSALKKSMEQCEFAEVKFFTNIKIDIEGVEVIQIPNISSKPEYSRFIIKELWKHIDTEFALIVQHDGYVICSEAWSDDFYSVDGIGSAWLYQDQRNNFNGGFCMMSKKLLNVLGNDPFIEIVSPDDEIIGRLYRNYLIEKHGIKFPTDEMCDRFAFELREPVGKTFGFHGNFHKPYQKIVIIIRKAAMGDVIQVEPVVQYFHDKGYRVVLSTLPQFHLLFANHHFTVHKMDGIDPRVLKGAKVVNLDGSYEAEPGLNHLVAYFKYAGVDEAEYTPYLKTPTLSVGFQLNESTKLFKKAVIFHIDNRSQHHRNVFNIEWDKIANYFNSTGYVSIQVGKDDTSVMKNAIKINCTNENMLSYVVGSAELMIGIDSGIAAIAAAYKVPSIIFSGSVDLRKIHYDLSNILWIHNHDKKVCTTPFCWHSVVGGTEGKSCYINEKQPPCVCAWDTETVLDKIISFLKRKELI